jgi:hypothetical protein
MAKKIAAPLSEQAAKTYRNVMTSFHNCTVRARVSELKALCGMPQYHSSNKNEKSQREWELVTKTKPTTYFNLYDWKEYRKYKISEMIEWYIGTETPEMSLRVEAILDSALRELRASK